MTLERPNVPHPEGRDKVANFERLDAKVDILAELDRLLAALRADEQPPVVAKELDQLLTAAQLRVTEADPNRTEFLANLTMSIATLKKRNQEVRYFEQHPEEIAAAIQAAPERQRPMLRSPRFSHAAFDTFHIALYVDENHPALPDARGRHIKHTPFVYLSAQDNDLAQVENHEARHILLESPDYFTMPPDYYPHSRLYNLFLDLLDKEQGDTSEGIPPSIEVISNRSILDAFHNELLAELPNLVADGLEDPYDYVPGTLQPVGRLAHELATAGDMALDAVLTWQMFAERSKDPDRQAYAKQQQHDLEERLLRMANGLYEGFKIADAMQAVPQALAACHILKPSQFHHLPSYLQQRYGAPAVQARQRQQQDRLAESQPGTRIHSMLSQ